MTENDAKFRLPLPAPAASAERPKVQKPMRVHPERVAVILGKTGKDMDAAVLKLGTHKRTHTHIHTGGQKPDPGRQDPA